MPRRSIGAVGAKGDRQQREATARSAGARRLLAGLRITPQEEALLNVVRPYLPEADSASELAYRLWRRGLELTLAEVASIGATLPPHTSEELLAGLAAQRLLLCMPLLRRTGKLALLDVEATPREALLPPEVVRPLPLAPPEHIDASASDAISGLGGNDFL